MTELRKDLEASIAKGLPSANDPQLDYIRRLNLIDLATIKEVETEKESVKLKVVAEISECMAMGVGNGAQAELAWEKEIELKMAEK